MSKIVATTEAQHVVDETRHHAANAVEIVGAKGFADRFEAYVIPGLDHLPPRDERGALAVIVTEVGDIHVVPSSTVRRPEPVKPDSPDAAAYRAEWAVKAHRNPADVYIPEALR